MSKPGALKRLIAASCLALETGCAVTLVSQLEASVPQYAQGVIPDPFVDVTREDISQYESDYPGVSFHLDEGGHKIIAIDVFVKDYKSAQTTELQNQNGLLEPQNEPKSLPGC